MFLIFSGDAKQYASVATSSRHRKHPTEANYLGRVIDKDRGIFKSKKRGYFTFDLETGQYGEVPSDFVIPETVASVSVGSRCIDFGDAFFIDAFLWQSGLMEVIDTIPFPNKDTLHAMICFYMLSSLANCDCSIWYQGSIARLLYPKANLSSQRISDFMAAVGKPDNRVNLLDHYSRFVLERYCHDKNILVDSTGLPNSIHMAPTCLNVHNGEVNIETRLIYVVQKSTGLPLFYESIPGNIVDVGTLERILCKLDAMSIDVDSCLIDAGYNSSGNLDLFYDDNHHCRIGFITRASARDIRLKAMIADNLKTIDSRENFVKYEDRYLFIVKKEILVGADADNPAWMYLGLDLARAGDEQKKLLRRAKKKKLDNNEVFDALQSEGFFGIISGREYKIEEILPAYYERQQIEQTFDIAKNYTKLLPLRDHGIETYNGHLLISFLASCAMKMIQLQLKTEDLFLGSKLAALRNEKCTIYKDRIVTDNIQAEARAVFDAFEIDCPVSIPIIDGKLSYQHPERKVSPYVKTEDAAGFIDESSQKEEKPKHRKRGRPPGSKNKKTLEREARTAAVAENESKPKRKRGRPPGSKNKKTLERERLEKLNQGGGEVKPSKRRGRPPGSKNKNSKNN